MSSFFAHSGNMQAKQKLVNDCEGKPVNEPDANTEVPPCYFKSDSIDGML